MNRFFQEALCTLVFGFFVMVAKTQLKNYRHNVCTKIVQDQSWRSNRVLQTWLPRLSRIDENLFNNTNHSMDNPMEWYVFDRDGFGKTVALAEAHNSSANSMHFNLYMECFATVPSPAKSFRCFLKEFMTRLDWSTKNQETVLSHVRVENETQDFNETLDQLATLYQMKQDFQEIYKGQSGGSCNVPSVLFLDETQTLFGKNQTKHDIVWRENFFWFLDRVLRRNLGIQIKMIGSLIPMFCENCEANIVHNIQKGVVQLDSFTRAKLIQFRPVSREKFMDWFLGPVNDFARLNLSDLYNARFYLSGNNSAVRRGGLFATPLFNATTASTFYSLFGSNFVLVEEYTYSGALHLETFVNRMIQIYLSHLYDWNISPNCLSESNDFLNSNQTHTNITRLISYGLVEYKMNRSSVILSSTLVGRRVFQYHVLS